jgi:hypothetical protein
MKQSKGTTLSFRLTEEQRATLERRTDPTAAGTPEERFEGGKLEDSFRAWNASFVDCREPVPE